MERESDVEAFEDKVISLTIDTRDIRSTLANVEIFYIDRVCQGYYQIKWEDRAGDPEDGSRNTPWSAILSFPGHSMDSNNAEAGSLPSITLRLWGEF